VARNFGGGVSLFGEAFHTTIDRVDGSLVALDGGMFRGLGKHAQLDFSAGHTVSGERPSWFLTAGCVLRVPRVFMPRF
jgi:hypothetical protein